MTVVTTTPTSKDIPFYPSTVYIYIFDVEEGRL